MPPRGTAPGSAAARRFFLERAPAPPANRGAMLCADDLRHATQVLRLSTGDRLFGLDGAGSEWPLAVVGRSARALELEVAGDARREARPGSPGAALPWIEIAVASPRGAAADEMLDRLTQLGAAAITPLRAERAQRPSSSDGARRDRSARIAREACKQSGRLWLPELREPLSPAELVDRERAALVVLDPLAARGLSSWIDANDRAMRSANEAAPIVIAIGPEGGFTDAESAAFATAGAAAVRIGPHVLRIETAAEAALAILVERAFTRSRS